MILSARGIDERPHLEWLDGVERPAEVSPNPGHGLVALAFARIIDDCGAAFGAAGVEVHIRLDDRPGKRTVLMPDVSFFRADSLRGLSEEDRLLPNVPPDVIVEVRSPNDRPGFREEKIRRYLAWGCPLVFDADPATRTIVAHTASETRTFRSGEAFSDPAFSWLTFPVDKVFE